MGLSRRQILVGGGVGVGLLIGWEMWPRRYRENLTAAPGETIFNAFLKIGEDGHVAIVACQTEMGQGVWTSLPQILADELGADWRTVSVEPAPINPLYANDFLARERAREGLPGFLREAKGWIAHEVATREARMMTAGSTSIRGFEARYREAGAVARALLCKAAARQWDAAWDACDTAAGFVIHGDDKMRFADVAADAARLAPPSAVPLRAPGAGGIAGRSVPRLDLPSKVDGSARFAGDVRLPDMVFAAVRQGPYGDTRLKSVDVKAADAVAGSLAIVRHPRFVAAVATNWWAANRALDAVAPVFVTTGPLADDASIEAALVAALEGPGTRFADVGDLAKAFASGRGHHAEYAVSTALHAAIEPLAATARLSGDRLEVWMPTQAPDLARAAAARAVGLAAEQVTIFPMLAGGGYGRHLEVEAAEQAAILARHMRRPVQLTWSRAEECIQDRFRPPARARLTATLDENGIVAGWQAKIATPATWGPTLARLKGEAGDPGHAEAEAVEGAAPPYGIGALAVDHHPAAIGVPTGVWRGGAHGINAFFTESFMDELARLAGVEPLSFRMQMLGGQPRLARCLTTVTALGDWDGGAPGSTQGIAAHSAFGSHIALLAEAHRGDGGQIAVDRIVAVVDAGRLIHPDIVLQQIEGGILWGIAAALGSATGFAGGLAEARNFDTLGLPRLAATPEIRIELIESNEAPGGVSGLGVAPVAPAIANALFAATGRRLRRLPLRAGGA